MEWIAAVWERFTSSDELIAAFLAFALPTLLLATNRWFARPKLKYGVIQNLVLLPPRADGSPGVWRVQRIQVANPGWQAAEDVEVIFNWRPPHIEQYPHLAVGDVVKGDGRYIVQVPRLNGREVITITIASDGPELPPVIYVRGKNLKAKVQHYREIVWLPLGWRIFVLVLLGLGFFTLIYLMVVLMGWLLFGRVPF